MVEIVVHVCVCVCVCGGGGGRACVCVCVCVCVWGGGGGYVRVIRVIRTLTYWVSSFWYNMGYYFLNRHVTRIGNMSLFIKMSTNNYSHSNI